MSGAPFFFSGPSGPNFGLIGNSLRFRGAEDLQFTPSTTSPNLRFTMSLWYKGSGPIGGNGYLLWSGARSNTNGAFGVGWTNEARLQFFTHRSSAYQKNTQQSLRDPAAWYHFIVAVDRTQSNSLNRERMWINGVEVTNWNSTSSAPQNAGIAFGSSGTPMVIGHGRNNVGAVNGRLDGYLAEYHAVDDVQITDPTTFGEFNADGVWVPKKVTGVTYNANGFYLDFSDPADIGADRSGNGNNFTATGFETTNTTSALYDWMADTPTGNFATFNPLAKANPGIHSMVTTTFNANLSDAFNRNAGDYYAATTMGLPDGANVYWEMTPYDIDAQVSIGIAEQNWTWNVSPRIGYVSTGAINNAPDGDSSGNVTSGATYGNNDVIGVAWNGTNKTVQFYKNGVAQGTANGPQVTAGKIFVPTYNAANSDAPAKVHFNAGQRPFAHTPPAGFEPLSTAGLADVAITNPSEHYQTLLGPGPSSGTTTPTPIQWKTSNTGSVNAQSEYYGKPAADANNNNDHPMFQWVKTLNLGGHTDWYIPAKWELEILFRNFKPTTDQNVTDPNHQFGPGGANPYACPPTGVYTSFDPLQTTVTSFQSGNANAFLSPGSGGYPMYWAATEPSGGPTTADIQNFTEGYQRRSGGGKSATNAGVARAIRRVPFTGSEPAIGAAYEGGFYAGPICAKASPDGVATHALIVAPKDGGEYGVGTGILDVAQRTFPSGLWWIKDRVGTNQHQFVDSVRGGNLALTCPTLSTEAAYVAPAGNSVAWCWKAGGAPVTNTDGSITSQVSANPTAGFSIVSYTGDGGQFKTIGHGLGVAPSMIIIKNRDSGNGWAVLHTSAGFTGSTLDGAPEYKMLRLDSADAASDFSSDCIWDPTSTTFKVAAAIPSNWVNESGSDHIAYCWAEVPGYSSIGKYVGNGSTDGTFVYTGFRPAFLMVKRTNTTGYWAMADSARAPYNPIPTVLYANGSNTDAAQTPWVDLLSNGFKFRQGWEVVNGSGSNYIYIAFAEHPFGGANVYPAPAR